MMDDIYEAQSDQTNLASTTSPMPLKQGGSFGLTTRNVITDKHVG
jgi:hypothetical protein